MSTTSGFVFPGQKTNESLDVTLDFLIFSQKANDRFRISLKILYFVVKERMVQF